MNLRFIFAIGVSLAIHLIILWITCYFTGIPPIHTGNSILQVNLAPRSNPAALNVKHTQPSGLKTIQPNIKATKVEPGNKKLGYIPEVKYYKLSELDQKPVATNNIDTNPIELRQYAQGGELTIELWISEFGIIEKAEIVKSDLPSEFNDYALSSFKNAKFLPGIKDGEPVKSVAKLTMQFRATD